MRLDKCDVFTTKKILGYKGRKTAAARGAAKGEGNQREQKETQTNKQITKVTQRGTL